MPEQHMRAGWRSFPGAACLAALAALALGALGLEGCASMKQSRAEDAQFTALQKLLPGRYDNASQVSADARAGAAGAHAAIELVIVRADADLIGKAVFYVRQSAANDPQRVLSQRIWVLGRAQEVRTKVSHVEQRIYLFKEPQRWLDVGDAPELLQALMPEDLRQLSGCELLWSKVGADKAGSDKVASDYEAHRKADSCHPASRSEGLLIEQRFELHGDRLSLIEQQVGPDGLVELSGSQVEPFYRFERRGQN
jgi:hypothetical protein